MNDVPRQKLVELVAKYGPVLSDDARRCEALLRDVCGQFKRENFVIVSAVKEHAAAELASPPDGTPVDVRLGRLALRLHEELGLPEDMARWGVETWALALGVVAESDVQRHFVCPVCGAKGGSSAALAGKVGRCPKCRALIEVSIDGRRFSRASMSGQSGGARPAGSTAAPNSSPAVSGSHTIFDEEESDRPEEVLRQALRKVLAAGPMPEEQKTKMQDLRRSLGISRELASEILLEVQAELRATAASAAGSNRSSSGSLPPAPTSKSKTTQRRPTRSKKWVVALVGVLGVFAATMWRLAQKPMAGDQSAKPAIVPVAAIGNAGTNQPPSSSAQAVATDPSAADKSLSVSPPSVGNSKDARALDVKSLLGLADACISWCDEQLRDAQVPDDVDQNLSSVVADHDRLINQIEQSDAEARWPTRVLGNRLTRDQATALRTKIEEAIAQRQKELADRRELAARLAAYKNKLNAARAAVAGFNQTDPALSTPAATAAGQNLRQVIDGQPKPARPISSMKPIDISSLLD